MTYDWLSEVLQSCPQRRGYIERLPRRQAASLGLRLASICRARRPDHVITHTGVAVWHRRHFEKPLESRIMDFTLFIPSSTYSALATYFVFCCLLCVDWRSLDQRNELPLRRELDKTAHRDEGFNYTLFANSLRNFHPASLFWIDFKLNVVPRDKGTRFLFRFFSIRSPQFNFVLNSCFRRKNLQNNAFILTGMCESIYSFCTPYLVNCLRTVNCLTVVWLRSLQYS